MRKRARDKPEETEIDRERGREIDTTERYNEADCKIYRDVERERQIQTPREKGMQMERQTDKERQTERLIPRQRDRQKERQLNMGEGE